LSVLTAEVVMFVIIFHLVLGIQDQFLILIDTNFLACLRRERSWICFLHHLQFVQLSVYSKLIVGIRLRFLLNFFLVFIYGFLNQGLVHYHLTTELGICLLLLCHRWLNDLLHLLLECGWLRSCFVDWLTFSFIVRAVNHLITFSPACSLS
jgi:hypothetical protein